jgi:uncharacterized protein
VNRASPFHPGEIEAQARAGTGPEGAGIRDFMSEQHRKFFSSLSFIVAASSDGSWPVATLLAGAPGFVSSPDRHTLRVASDLDRSDPAQRLFEQGVPAGILGIDLASRRRNRANGVISSVDGANGFVLDVRQSFGNCPQYIQVRNFRPAPGTCERAEALQQLDRGARDAISAADTFFVASAARTTETAGGADISHRGGPPGFVRVEGNTLTIPDFSGNGYFNTLGNLVSNPRAALLFVDFANGELLHLQGTTEIVWDGPEVHAFNGAGRLWRVHVERAWRRRGCVVQDR